MDEKKSISIIDLFSFLRTLTRKFNNNHFLFMELQCGENKKNNYQRNERNETIKLQTREQKTNDQRK